MAAPVCDRCEEPVYIRTFPRKEEARPGLAWAHKADDTLVCGPPDRAKGIRPMPAPVRPRQAGKVVPIGKRWEDASFEKVARTQSRQ